MQLAIEASSQSSLKCYRLQFLSLGMFDWILILSALYFQQLCAVDVLIYSCVCTQTLEEHNF